MLETGHRLAFQASRVGAVVLQPTSFSVEPGRSRANMSAVYALFGVVLIPVSFMAIRLSQKFIHPVVFDRHGPNMAGSQFFVFCVALVAMLALFATLYNVELAGKRLDAHLRELRELLA